MKVSAYPITLTQVVADGGVGSTTTTFPIVGEIIEVRGPAGGTMVFASAGTTDLTITRVNDGGTVLAVSNVTPPFQYQPRRAVHTDAGGTTAYSVGGQTVVDAAAGIPIDGYLKVAWASGTTIAGTDTLYVYAREM